MSLVRDNHSITFLKYPGIHYFEPDEFCLLPEGRYNLQVDDGWEATTLCETTAAWMIRFLILTGAFSGKYFFYDFAIKTINEHEYHTKKVKFDRALIEDMFRYNNFSLAAMSSPHSMVGMDVSAMITTNSFRETNDILYFTKYEGT